MTTEQLKAEYVKAAWLSSIYTDLTVGFEELNVDDLDRDLTDLEACQVRAEAVTERCLALESELRERLSREEWIDITVDTSNEIEEVRG